MAAMLWDTLTFLGQKVDQRPAVSSQFLSEKQVFSVIFFNNCYPTKTWWRYSFRII